MLHGADTESLAAACQRGLDFVAGEQLPAGNFISYSSAQPLDFQGARTCQTVLLPSLLAAALGVVDDPKAGQICTQVALWLKGERNTAGSYNYWPRQSSEATESPYPDDLDDTAAALFALQQVEPPAVDGATLAAFAQCLIATEESPGGPYRTWLVEEDAATAWRDTDPAVNANIGRFLAAQEVSLPKLEAYFDARLANDDLRSRYYPDEAMAVYFLSSWYTGEGKERLIEAMLGKVERPVNILSHALRIAALCRLGALGQISPAAVGWLVAQQQPDGSWPAQAVCFDPAADGTVFYAGAAALTTAICLEALTLAHKNSVVAEHRPPSREMDMLYRLVVWTVRQKIATIKGPDLQRSSRQALQRLVRQDTDRQIVLLPALVAKAAQIDVGAKLQQDFGAASLWGWVAYTLYDDVQDGDADGSVIPAANFATRQLLKTLDDALPNDSEFQAETAHILERMDEAAAWELAHCRARFERGSLVIRQLPDYGDYWALADRSLGHTIGSLGILYSGGDSHRGSHRGSRQADITALRSFFRNYLIARQLNDDAHDWQDDLARGQINAVGVEVLRAWRPGQARLRLRLERVQQELDGLFWETVLPSVAVQIREHTAAARRALAGSALRPELLVALLEPLERAAATAEKERQHTLQFIARLETAG